MARDRANIRTDMIGDDHYRELTRDEQWLYKLLLIHPTLTYAGVAEWRPGRLAATAAETTADDVRRIGAGLQAKYFVFIDEDTEEVFIRSFVKHDGLMKQYRLPVSMANDYAGIASQPIREFFIFELQKYQAKEPDLKCWEIDRVRGLLGRVSRNMKELSYGDTLPITFAEGYADTYGEGYGIDPKQGYGLATTTATSTATSIPKGIDVLSEPPAESSPKNDPGLNGTRIPSDFKISNEMIAWALEHCPNLDARKSTEAFKRYFRSVSGTAQFKTDWNAAWELWLIRDQTKAESGQPLTASDRRLQQGKQIVQRAANRQAPAQNPFEGKELTR